MSDLSPRNARLISCAVGLVLSGCFGAVADAQITYLNNLGSGQGSNSNFAAPRGVAVDSSGTVYVADTGDQRIQVFSSSGVYANTIGTTGSAGAGNNQFSNPLGVAIGPSSNIYVADSGNSRVQVFNASGVYQSTLGTTGSIGTGNNQFSYPSSVAVGSSGNIYVADTNNSRVQIFNASGVYQSTLGTTNSPGPANNQFAFPSAITAGPSGNIYVADTANARVQVLNSSGLYQSTIGTTASSGSGNNQFTYPNGVAVGSSGNIYVADTGNSRVQIFNSSGVYQSTLGGFGSPTGIAIGANGMLYVAVPGSNSVDRFFDPNSWVSGTDIFTDPTAGPTSIALGNTGGNLTINASMGLVVGNTTTINPGSILTLNGGSLSTNALAVSGTFLYQSGTLRSSTFTPYTLNVGSGGNFQATQGGSLSQIASVGIANGGNMTLDGGVAVNTSSVTIAPFGLLTMNQATLISSNGISLANDGEIQLGNSARSIIQTPALTNAGMIDGSGEIIGSFQNIGGQLIVSSSQIITVTGTGNANANGGEIALAGGTLHFTQSLANYPGGTITGFGSLYVNGGLNNIGGIITLGGGAIPTSVFGAMNSSSDATLNLAGSAYIFGPVNADNTTTIHLSAGTNIFYNTVSGSANLQVDPNASGYFESQSTVGPVLDNGLLDFTANSTTGPVTGSGTIIIGSQSTPAVVVISPNALINSASAITINQGSKLDITGNTLTLNTTSSGQNAAAILSELTSGYDHGAWDGPGIGSSLAAGNGATTLGYSIVGNTFTIQYTWVGDVNLSGTVTNADLLAMAPSGTTNATWSQGDFNYDGVVNGDDYSLLLLGIAESGGGNISTTLPEPGVVALLAIAGVALMRRRRIMRI